MLCNELNNYPIHQCLESMEKSKFYQNESLKKFKKNSYTNNYKFNKPDVLIVREEDRISTRLEQLSWVPIR